MQKNPVVQNFVWGRNTQKLGGFRCKLIKSIQTNFDFPKTDNTRTSEIIFVSLEFQGYSLWFSRLVMGEKRILYLRVYHKMSSVSPFIVMLSLESQVEVMEVIKEEMLEPTLRVPKIFSLFFITFKLKQPNLTFLKWSKEIKFYFYFILFFY